MWSYGCIVDSVKRYCYKGSVGEGGGGRRGGVDGGHGEDVIAEQLSFGDRGGVGLKEVNMEVILLHGVIIDVPLVGSGEGELGEGHIYKINKRNIVFLVDS